MKTKRFCWKLLLLCAIPFVPLLAATSFRDSAYRVAAFAIPPLREARSHELRMEVSSGGDLKKIRHLIARGADVNPSQRGQAPLDLAISGNHLPIALLLVQNGADPNHRSTPLEPTMFYRAVTQMRRQTNSLHLANEMLKRGANVNNAAGTNDNHLLYEVIVRQNYEMAKLLITYGANVNARASKELQGENRTVLMAAAFKGCQDIVKALLQRGANVNAVVTINQTNRAGLTALQLASYEGHESVVNELLRHGADPNLSPKKRGNDYTLPSLLQCVIKDSYAYPKLAPDQRRMIRALLAHGANVNLGNEYSMPLQSVSSRFAPDVVREFLKRGAKVNWQNKSGWSALIGAASVGDLQTVKLLLQVGANKSLRDEDGKTALAWARRGKHLDVVRVLE